MQQETSGQVFRSKIVGDDSLAAEYPSFGHYFIDRLGGPLADSVLLVDCESGREWTGAKLKTVILNVASCLIDKYDFSQGSVVCVNYDHNDYACILALGVVCAGGTLCYLDTLCPYQELLYMARKVEMKYFAAKQANMYKVDQLEIDMGYPIKRIMLPDDWQKAIPSSGAKDFEHLIGYNHLEANCKGKVPVACKSLEQDIAFITLSSGTTGMPKAIGASHLNLLAEAALPVLIADMVFLNPSPLNYVSGRAMVTGAVSLGFKVVITNGFDPKTYLDAVQKHKINYIFLGAASFHTLINYANLDEYDLSSVRIAAPVGARIVYFDQFKAFLAKNKQILFSVFFYGASECGVVARLVVPTSDLDDIATKVGQLNAGISVKIVCTETGQLMGQNQVGSVLVHSSRNFPGYYDAQVARQRHAQGGSILVKDESVFDSDGFYKTGDMGFFDDEENLHITGRDVERMFCCNALKVLPIALELVLLQHPAVHQACVIPVKSKFNTMIDCPRAFIVPKPFCYLAETKDKDFTTERLDDPELAKLSNVTHQDLKFKGHNELCTLPDDRRRRIQRDIVAFMNERVSFEKRLVGGVVLLDQILETRTSGKVHKAYLRSLDLRDFEIFGDLSE